MMIPVVLKGYMYLTKKQICFFAQMPDREVLFTDKHELMECLESDCQDRFSVQEGVPDEDEHEVLGCTEE